jgi:hypothetical protein
LDFRKDTQDPDRQLYDGLSWARYVQGVRPDIPIYVLSMNADDRRIQGVAREMGLNVRGWYDKLRPRSDRFSPWLQIERDIIIEALKSEASFRREAQTTGENPADLLHLLDFLGRQENGLLAHRHVFDPYFEQIPGQNESRRAFSSLSVGERLYRLLFLVALDLVRETSYEGELWFEVNLEAPVPPENAPERRQRDRRQKRI